VKIRCFVHVLLGAGLPWLSTEVNLGGVIFFCAYQYLQYRHHSSRQMKDDSYLDIKETAVAYIISAVIKRLIGVV